MGSSQDKPQTPEPSEPRGASARRDSSEGMHDRTTFCGSGRPLSPSSKVSIEDTCAFYGGLPDSPVSSLSLSSDDSKGLPPEFSGEHLRPQSFSIFHALFLRPHRESLSSDDSKGLPPDFREEPPDSLVSSLSLSSDDSKGLPPEFSGEHLRPQLISEGRSSPSLSSDDSKGLPPDFREDSP